MLVLTCNWNYPVDFLYMCTFSNFKCKYLYMWMWYVFNYTKPLSSDWFILRSVKYILQCSSSAIHNLLQYTLFFILWFFHSISQNNLSAFTLATVQMTMNCVCWSVHFILWLFYCLYIDCFFFFLLGLLWKYIWVIYFV